MIALIRLAAVTALCTTALAACSDAQMTSYEAEKSRIRKALPSVIECKENPYQGGKMLECGRGPFSLTMIGMKQDGGKESVMLDTGYNEFFGRDPAVFKGFLDLLAAYKFGDSDFDQCASAYQHRKQADGFIVICNRARSGRDFSIKIMPQTAV